MTKKSVAHQVSEEARLVTQLITVSSAPDHTIIIAIGHAAIQCTHNFAKQFAADIVAAIGEG